MATVLETFGDCVNEVLQFGFYLRRSAGQSRQDRTLDQ